MRQPPDLSLIEKYNMRFKSSLAGPKVPRVDRVDVTLKDGRKGKGKTIAGAIKNAQHKPSPG